LCRYHAHVIDTLCTANPQARGRLSLAAADFSAAMRGISFSIAKVSTYQIEIARAFL
jgi:hypothetical protein